MHAIAVTAHVVVTLQRALVHGKAGDLQPMASQPLSEEVARGHLERVPASTGAPTCAEAWG